MASGRDLTQLTINQQVQLFDELNRREQMEAGTQRRRHRRFTFRTPQPTLIHVKSGSNTDQYSVLLRNLSAAGCSFLHNSFLYPQNHCLVELRKNGGERPTIPGVIKRCTLVSGWVHEIGVQFNSPIDVDSFISDADRPKQTEPEDPAWTEGRRIIQKLKATIDAHDPVSAKKCIEELLAWRSQLPSSSIAA